MGNVAFQCDPIPSLIAYLGILSLVYPRLHYPLPVSSIWLLLAYSRMRQPLSVSNQVSVIINLDARANDVLFFFFFSWTTLSEHICFTRFPPCEPRRYED